MGFVNTLRLKITYQLAHRLSLPPFPACFILAMAPLLFIMYANADISDIVVKSELIIYADLPGL